MRALFDHNSKPRTRLRGSGCRNETPNRRFLPPPSPSVTFSRVDQGTAEDYALLDALAKPYIAKTGERVLDYLERMGLDVGSAKQIGMGTGSRQHNAIVVNVPDQQPVRLDMTFPSARPLPGQAVGPVAAIKRLLGEEQVDDEDDEST